MRWLAPLLINLALVQVALADDPQVLRDIAKKNREYQKALSGLQFEDQKQGDTVWMSVVCNGSDVILSGPTDMVICNEDYRAGLAMEGNKFSLLGYKDVAKHYFQVADSYKVEYICQSLADLCAMKVNKDLVVEGDIGFLTMEIPQYLNPRDELPKVAKDIVVKVKIDLKNGCIIESLVTEPNGFFRETKVTYEQLQNPSLVVPVRFDYRIRPDAKAEPFDKWIVMRNFAPARRLKNGEARLPFYGFPEPPEYQKKSNYQLLWYLTACVVLATVGFFLIKRASSSKKLAR